MSKRLYLLFAGHSGSFYFQGKAHYLTAGKRSPDVGVGTGIYEGVFNRAVCKYIDHSADVQTCFVNPGVDNMTQARRVELANDIHRRCGKKAVTLSVHANAAGEPGWSDAHGFKTFHAIQSSNDSRALARIIDGRFSALEPGESRGVSGRNLWILRRTIMPAALFETAFMTNKKDAEFMSLLAGVRYYGKNLCRSLEMFDELHG